MNKPGHFSLVQLQTLVNVVVCDDSLWAMAEASEFASQWGLELEIRDDLTAPKLVEFSMLYSDLRISLKWNHFSQMKPTYVDFLNAKVKSRLASAKTKKDLLYKSCGGSRALGQVIFDPFAGLGMDAFLLSSMGFHVHAMEINPVIYALFEDGYRRWLEAVKSVASQNLFVHRDDSSKFDGSQISDQKIDIVYLDPMFPDRKKSAAVGKEMQVIRRLYVGCLIENTTLSKAGKNEDKPLEDLNQIYLVKLIRWAKTQARRRVILKRPRKYDVKLEGIDVSYSGKSIRYDVFIQK